MRDRLDSISSSYNSIDTHQATRRSQTSPAADGRTTDAMLQQTKDEFHRLVQTLRSSKQTIESKQQRLQTLEKQYHDLEHEYRLITTARKPPEIDGLIKDDQYEYKDECQRRRVRQI